jgi:hypothetical protein
MEHRYSPGLSPLWLMALAMTLGVFLTLAIPLIISAGTINSTAWIGFAGSCVGGAVAIIAVVVATWNVRRQLRVNLLSREEERMETQLPGLQEIAGLLHGMLPGMKPDPKAVISELRPIQSDLDLSQFNSTMHAALQGEPGPITDESLKKVIPLADHVTRQHLLVIMQSVERAAYRLQQQNKGGEIGKNLGMLVLMTELQNLREFEKTLMRRIASYDDRLKAFRNEIEEFFRR